MANRNTSGLAGEFLVAGELSRRGYLVSITMGNAKAVDIHASTQSDKQFMVDVKASRIKTGWPVGRIDESLYYIFVYLQSEAKITSNSPSEYFIASGKELIERGLVRHFKSMQDVMRSALNTKD